MNSMIRFFIGGIVLMLGIGCSHYKGKPAKDEVNHENATVFVSVPRSPLFGKKPFPAMDSAIAEAVSDHHLNVDLVFSHLGAQSPQNIALHGYHIDKGSVTIATGDWSVTLLPDHAYQVHREANNERKLLKLGDRDLSDLAIWAHVDDNGTGVARFRVGTGSILPVDQEGQSVEGEEWTWFNAPLAVRKGKKTLRISIETSEDFEGSLSGWFLWTPA